MSKIIFPIGYYPNPDKFGTVALGDLYIGEPDQNPVVNEKTVTAQQEDGTEVSMSQPISLSAGGVPLYAGSPVTLFVDGNFSMTVLDSLGVQVYNMYNSALEVTEIYDSVADLRAVSATPDSGQKVTVTGYYVPGDGGGQDLVWDSASTATDNGYTIFKLTAIATGRFISISPYDLTVRHAGAKGDAATDDYTAIQACIDAVEATGGGEVKFPEGDFWVSSKLVLSRTGTAVRGTGGGTSILGTHDGTVLEVHNAAGCTRMGVFNIDIGYQRASDCTTGAGLYIGRAGQSRFEGVRVTNAYGQAAYDGIYVTGASQCFFDNVRSNGCARHGIYIGSPTIASTVDIWVTDSEFDANGGHGIYIINANATYSVEGLYLTRCSCWNNTLSGMDINVSNNPPSGNANYFLDDVILDFNGVAGLTTEGTGNLVDLKMANVWAASNGSYGIFIRQDVIVYEIHGGFIANNGLDGVRTQGTSGRIQDLTVWENSTDADETYFGISVEGPNTTVSGNRIINTVAGTPNQNGLEIVAGATDTDIYNNFLDTGSATPANIYLDGGTRTRAYNNVLDESLTYAQNHSPIKITSILGTVATLADEGTPTVLNGSLFLTGGTTTITDFDDGLLGQTISIKSGHAITITDNANIELNASGNFVMADGDTLTLTMFEDQVWTEVGRMDLA